MQIISWQFVVFYLIVLIVYFFLPRRSQDIWLLIASFFFLATWNVYSVAILTASILFNYVIGLKIWQGARMSRKWLWLGIIINVLTLFIFRLGSSGYLEKGIRAFLHLSDPAGSFELSILLPVGFSYYCLQAISYLVDISKKQCEPSNDLVDFGLYMAYFPRMLAGPIERARSFLPILSNPRIVDNDRLSRGFIRIVIGLVRKVIIAGAISSFIPANLFSETSSYSSFDLVLRLILYAFWIYNDFAGYTSIVRGISDLFGIDLSPNFDTPYFAHSFTDFWNRWHISLSHWLRDYIFFPFSRTLLRKRINPRSITYLSLPPILTMLISGLWHSFGAFVVIWGLLHGIFQVLEKLASRGKTIVNWDGKSKFERAGSIFLVFIGVVIAWLPFASGSLYRVKDFISSIMTSTIKPEINTLLLIPLFAVGLSYCLDLIHYIHKDELAFRRWPVLSQSIALAIAILAITVSLLGGQSALANFVYQGF